MVELAKFLALTLLFPSGVYIALRSQHPPQRGHRVAGWFCLWAGQLAVPMVLAAWLALFLGQHCVHFGYPVSGLVFGGGGAAIAALVTLDAVRTVRTGVSVLRAKRAQTLHHLDRSMRWRVLLPLAGCVLLLGLMSVLPIPGEWTPAVFMMGVLFPVGASSAMLMVVAGVTSRVHQMR